MAQLPVNKTKILSTAQRDAQTSVSDGDTLINSDTGNIEYRFLSSWQESVKPSDVTMQAAYDGGNSFQMLAANNFTVNDSSGNPVLSAVENGTSSFVDAERKIAINTTSSARVARLEFNANFPSAFNDVPAIIQSKSLASNSDPKINNFFQSLVVDETSATYSTSSLFNVISGGVDTQFMDMNGVLDIVRIFAGNGISSPILTLPDSGQINVSGSSTTFDLVNNSQGSGSNINISPGETIFFKPLNLQSGVNISFPFANNSIGSNSTGALDQLWVNTINGITPTGGIFFQRVYGTLVTSTTVETSIIGTGEGSLTFPANSLPLGVLSFVISGDISALINDTLTLRLKSNGSVLLAEVVLDLQATTNKFFEIEIEFNVTKVGGFSVATSETNIQGSYNRDLGDTEFVGNQNVMSNTSTFDTTIPNTLSVTAEFSSASATNSLQSRCAHVVRSY